MTLGERLQQLRKEKQMSQEELGNLLLVSRQTVSLWENNQTVPTVDNLIRLKEIFGVSLDSILTGEEQPVPEPAQPVQAQAPTGDYYIPIESYSYSMEKNDLSYMSKIYSNKSLRSAIICLTTSLSFGLGSRSDNDTSALVVIFFILSAVFFTMHICNLFSLRKIKNGIYKESYTCELYQGYCTLKTYINSELMKTTNIPFSEIKSCWDIPNCYLLVTKDRSFLPIKKSMLTENSYISSCCNNLKTGKTDFRSKNIIFLKTAATLSLVGTILAFFMCVGKIGNNLDSLTKAAESANIARILFVIPIISLLVGVILNKNKIRNIKNIVVGIMAGSFIFCCCTVSALPVITDNYIHMIEDMLGFTIPAYADVNFSSTLSNNENVIFFTLAESEANEFEDFIENDTRWLKEDKEFFAEIMVDSAERISSDFYLIYNITTNEFGKLPDTEGEYEFICITYNTEMNTAYIYQYTADYKS